MTVIAGVSGTDVVIDINGYYAPVGLSLGTIFNYTGNATVNSALATIPMVFCASLPP